ncbi:MAG TPA: hypothetical protein VEB22_14780 [Phycisphaerales bacterium]|nr:hypothetical protein [Phycisphaerales bacterium]
MDSVRVEQGGISDYDALARYHYRSGRPAVPAAVLRAVCGGATVGVVVIAMPVLNGPWRTRAWPGWLDGLDKRSSADAINAHVRTIARLVVAPPFRSRGVGCALVRAYLAAPLSRRTEALAAMGEICPVFERAGMRRIDCPLSGAGRRLVRALGAAGVRPWMLADRRTRRRVARCAQVERALRSLAAERWRSAADAAPQELVERLWVHAASRPVAFVAG